MTALFGRIIRSCGQKMTCYDEEGRWLCAGMAVLQPLPEDRRQSVGSELGRWDTGKFRALAEPDMIPAEGGWVTWNGGRYEVLAVRPIHAFGAVTHLWMVLRKAGDVPV